MLVPDGVTLEVTLSTTDGSDAALYLLGQCNNPGTCVAGEDTPGNIETLVYTNSSGANQQLTLAVDSQGPVLGPFNLTIDLF